VISPRNAQAPGLRSTRPGACPVDHLLRATARGSVALDVRVLDPDAGPAADLDRLLQRNEEAGALIPRIARVGRAFVLSFLEETGKPREQ